MKFAELTASQMIYLLDKLPNPYEWVKRDKGKMVFVDLRSSYIALRRECCEEDTYYVFAFEVVSVGRDNLDWRVVE